MVDWTVVASQTVEALREPAVMMQAGRLGVAEEYVYTGDGKVGKVVQYERGPRQRGVYDLLEGEF